MNNTTVSDLFLSRIRSFYLTEDGSYRAERYWNGYVVVRWVEDTTQIQILQQSGEWVTWSRYDSSYPYGPRPKIFPTILSTPKECRDKDW